MRQALFVRDNFGNYTPADPGLVIAAAKREISAMMARGKALVSPDAVREALQVQLADYQHEVFLCLFLDNQHRIIECVELFRGTIDGASVYPREVVKEALTRNTAAVIFCHNHPSGIAEPSSADHVITRKLKEALSIVDIRTLDHFIVAAEGTYSFAERGLL
jgi:DNA repair protein RadC